MLSERTLPDDLAAVRDEYTPNTLVLDCARDFESLPAEHRDDLALLTDDLHPHGYQKAWLPDDAPELLRRLAGSDLVVGMPGDGSVAWTTQTTPPVVLVKPRVEGSPEAFVDFLVAEALVESGLDLSEQFLGFFEERYPGLDAALAGRSAPCSPDRGLAPDPTTTYQVAAALCDAYRGLHTRDEFADWADDRPRLHDAWADAGDRLQGRVGDLPGAVARGDTDFADATELSCAGVKHGLDLPAPYDALDSLAYREHGAAFAVKWAEKL
jgi:hypothetical protein